MAMGRIKIWSCAWLGFLLVFATGALHPEPRRVMLVNSDASVEKYRAAQEAFKKTWPYPVLEVNLGDRRWSDQRIENLLYDEYPHLVYCIGSKAYFTANKYIGERNIVFTSIINWARLPVTESTYGVSNELHAGMQLMTFRYIFPGIKKIGVLYSDKYTVEWFRQTREQAGEMGMEIMGEKVAERKHAAAALKNLLSRIDAFWLISDPLVMSDKGALLAIMNACDAEKIPVFSYNDVFARLGSVLVVSVDAETIGRQAAIIAGKVVSGDAAKKRKIQYPAGSRVTLNLKKALEYDLKYCEDSLGSVNTLIE